MLTERFEQALVLAHRLHLAQRRKATDTPYVSHLLAVAAIVLEHGGTEDEAIAALLHDAVEDQGGPPTLARIRAEFGDEVAAIVAACTDTDTVPKPPWKPRKEAYIAHLATASPAARRVSAADKLHNARAIVSDLRRHGDLVWARFAGHREGTLWYYETLVETLRATDHSPLVEELARTVVMMRELADEIAASPPGTVRPDS
ncbi:MAG: HD domain-containing protein [Pirellulales bacterium]|nr:HD domain-containing protein [Pirellulales bacterium]